MSFNIHNMKIPLALFIFVFMFCVSSIDAFAQESAVGDEEQMAETEKAEEIANEVSEEGGMVKQRTVVSPSVIDENFLAGEIGKYSIKLKNNTDRKYDIYATINNVTSKDGKIKFETVSTREKAVSAANWILIRRGVIELLPNEEVSVPLEIRVPANAVPGKYFVSASFPIGPNRKAAEDGMANKSFSDIRINIDIRDNIIERAKILKFATERNVYLTNNIAFSVELENFGNRKIDPSGYIYVFNRKGAEIEKIEIAKGSYNLGPGQVNEIEKFWTGGTGAGKYKVKIELEYGENGTRDMQDTLYFWILPWKALLVFLSLMLILVFILTFVIFKKTYKRK